ncbi:MAG: hypothetical protein KF782_15470 [Labilithrix sp.]|nr:hypothetical protein [Labilithrix sp.]
MDAAPPASRVGLADAAFLVAILLSFVLGALVGAALARAVIYAPMEVEIR